MMSDRRHQRKLEKMKKRGERYKAEAEMRDAYFEYVPERKKRKVSNIMLFIIVAAVIGYVVAAFALQYFTGTEVSPTITTCWFSVWGVELLSLAGIKVSKTKNGGSDDSVG